MRDLIISLATLAITWGTVWAVLKQAGRGIPLPTSVITAVSLAAIGLVMLSLGLWLSFGSYVVGVGLWVLLALQRLALIPDACREVCPHCGGGCIARGLHEVHMCPQPERVNAGSLTLTGKAAEWFSEYLVNTEPDLEAQTKQLAEDVNRIRATLQRLSLKAQRVKRGEKGNDN